MRDARNVDGVMYQERTLRVRSLPFTTRSVLDKYTHFDLFSVSETNLNNEWGRYYFATEIKGKKADLLNKQLSI